MSTTAAGDLESQAHEVHDMTEADKSGNKPIDVKESERMFSDLESRLASESAAG